MTKRELTMSIGAVWPGMSETAPRFAQERIKSSLM